MNKSEFNTENTLAIQSTINNLAQEAGFELSGFTSANIKESDQTNIQSFIDKNYFASMNWFPERQNIRIRFENLGFPVASCIVLGLVYKPSKESEETCQTISKAVSRYAWGKDYHKVLKEKAKPIMNYLRASFPNYKFRQAVDSLPIPEKILARDAGLGWIGKNTILINSNLGSYFFLTVILSELNLHKEDETQDAFKMYQKDRCGTCTACMDACPTKAIVQAYQLDSNLCISHNTIELKSEILPDNVKNHGWIYGCDICQEVCPWNNTVARKKNIQTKVKDFDPIDFFSESKSDLAELNAKKFDEHFAQSAIHRIGYKKWNRNIKAK